MLACPGSAAPTQRRRGNPSPKYRATPPSLRPAADPDRPRATGAGRQCAPVAHLKELPYGQPTPKVGGDTSGEEFVPVEWRRNTTKQWNRGNDWNTKEYEEHEWLKRKAEFFKLPGIPHQLDVFSIATVFLVFFVFLCIPLAPHLPLTR